MNWNRSIRQAHRWLSILFTLGVIANIVTMSLTVPPFWVGLLALIPLIFLLVSGLYMFALPYFRRA